MRTIALRLYDQVRPKKLLDTVTLIVMLLVVVLLVAIGSIFTQMTFDIVEKQTEKRAIQTAKHLALLPELVRFIQQRLGIEAIVALTESIQAETEAEYVVIADDNGTILSHRDPALVGARITAPLTLRALTYGRAYSEHTEEDGQHFIRGSVPVIDANYRIIGMVSVGYTAADIRKVSDVYLERVVFFIFVFITLGLVAAIFIARGVKWVIFGLEPSEIAYLFKERTALIESIREGIIATDGAGTITLVNEAALQTLALPSREEIIGRPIAHFLPPLDTDHIMRTGEPVSDREFVIEGIPIIVNVEPVEQRRGLVVSFRKKEEIDMIARELSQVQTFSEMLRAQTHEYSNSLHTIVGLIQIGAYDDVLAFIADETRGHRKLIRFLAENLPDRILSSLIIGKYMYALELKVDFRIDPESRMLEIPDSLDRHTLSTALGNIIDNGFEAALAGPGPPAVVLCMSDFGDDLIFEVEDSGPGIAPDIRDRLFDREVSTKPGAGRGYGLYLAKKSIDTLGGTIDATDGETGGTRFEIILPKRGYGS